VDPLLREALDDLLPELPQRDAVAQRVRVLLEEAGHVALRRVVVHPRRRSGAERWKKESACDCTNWAQWSSSRSFDAASGIRTAMMASQAFTEASRWLTGQMPQMRAVMDGIS